MSVEMPKYFSSSWRRRYFVLKNGYVFYYKSKAAFDSAPQEPINTRPIFLLVRFGVFLSILSFRFFSFLLFHYIFSLSPFDDALLCSAHEKCSPFLSSPIL